jgi:glutaconate CoA-transferase subunit B
MTLQITKDELLIISVAKQIENGDKLLLGIGLPITAGAIAKNTHAPDAILMMESGMVDFKPLVTPGHVADACCCKGYSYAVDLFSMFTSITHRGFIDKAILGVGQIDKFGNVNSSYKGDDPTNDRRITGAGGAPEFISYAKETILTLKGGEFVEKLPYFTSPGYFNGGDERDKKGYYPKGSGPKVLITPHGIFKFDSISKELYLDALFPGVTLDEVKAMVPWDLKVADPLSKYPTATDAEVLALRRFSPGSAFTKPVATELSMANMERRIMERAARLNECKSATPSAS